VSRLLESLGLDEGVVLPDDLLHSLLVVSKFVGKDAVESSGGDKADDQWDTPPASMKAPGCWEYGSPVHPGLCLWSSVEGWQRQDCVARRIDAREHFRPKVNVGRVACLPS